MKSINQFSKTFSVSQFSRLVLMYFMYRKNSELPDQDLTLNNTANIPT